MSPRIALVNGQWAQNVGNAFFNIGGNYILTKVFGDNNVGLIQDQPGYRTLHNKLKGNPKNYVDFASWLDIDYLVLQGPVLNSWMRANWEKTFKTLKKNNVKIIFLSCAFFKFTKAEIASVKGFLDDYPPYGISTRDPKSFEILKNWLPDVPKHNGIDSGFFVNKVFRPFQTRKEKYFVTNFDRYPEPLISDVSVDKRKYIEQTVTISGEKVYLSVPKFQNWASHRSKIWSYIGDLLDRRQLDAKFNNLTIVRTEHRYFPHMTYKIYRQPNATASDEPWTYLHIYANAEFTLSDRVHACVASLAFGKPAMLFTPSPRSHLFEAVGASKIKTDLIKINLDDLNHKQNEVINWLASIV